MIFVPSLIRILSEKGLTAAEIADVVEVAMGADIQVLAVETSADRKRARDRQRMATKRDNERLSRDISDNDDGRSGNPLPPALPPQTPLTHPPTPVEITTREGQKPDPKGKRLSEDWTPTDTDIATARKRGLTDPEIEIEADKFRNYWCSRPGAGGRKSSWPRTWDNHCIAVLERRGNGPRLAASSGQSGGNRQGSGSFADIIAKRRGFT